MILEKLNDYDEGGNYLFVDESNVDTLIFMLW